MQHPVPGKREELAVIFVQALGNSFAFGNACCEFGIVARSDDLKDETAFVEHKFSAPRCNAAARNAAQFRHVRPCTGSLALRSKTCCAAAPRVFATTLRQGD